MSSALITFVPIDFFDRLAEIIRAWAADDGALPGRLHELGTPW
ncbi:hypothetical protein ACIBI9_53945 [Nonomuraea sp. NPDC050451]